MRSHEQLTRVDESGEDWLVPLLRHLHQHVQRTLKDICFISKMPNITTGTVEITIDCHSLSGICLYA